jgi:hypothetical protein
LFKQAFVQPSLRSNKTTAAMVQVRTAISLVLGIIGASLGMLCAGTVYHYAAYGPQLDRRLNLTQAESVTIVSIGDYGLYLTSLLVGYIADSLRFGGVGMMIAAIGGFGGGYSLMALAYNGLVFSGWIGMSIYFFMVGIRLVFLYRIMHSCIVSHHSSVHFLLLGIGPEKKKKQRKKGRRTR